MPNFIMEASAPYALVARFNIDALTLLTVRDTLTTGAFATAEEREKGYPIMAEIALEIAP